MMRRRSSSLKRNQEAISSRVRPQPSHKPVWGSRMHTRMQGVEARVMNVRSDTDGHPRAEFQKHSQVAAKATMGSRFDRQQERNQTSHFGDLLDGPCNVPRMSADEPMREARQNEAGKSRKCEHERDSGK